MTTKHLTEAFFVPHVPEHVKRQLQKHILAKTIYVIRKAVNNCR